MSDIRIVSRSSQPFTDRTEAGRLLGEALLDLNLKRPLVLGIPRGGLITALEIARVVSGDLDIVLSRKLRAPFNPELAMGAITESGRVFLDDNLLGALGVTSHYLEQEKIFQLADIQRRLQLIRGVLTRVPLDGREVVVTDDGVATGSTMQSALWAARQEHPARLVCALPVAPSQTAEQLAESCDSLVLLRAPDNFHAVGQFYARFDQVEDDTVLDILRHESERRRLAVR
jgi:putative phosphoribosyl transferase